MSSRGTGCQYLEQSIEKKWKDCASSWMLAFLTCSHFTRQYDFACAQVTCPTTGKRAWSSRSEAGRGKSCHIWIHRTHFSVSDRLNSTYYERNFPAYKMQKLTSQGSWRWRLKQWRVEYFEPQIGALSVEECFQCAFCILFAVQAPDEIRDMEHYVDKMDAMHMDLQEVTCDGTQFRLRFLSEVLRVFYGFLGRLWLTWTCDFKQFSA